MRERLERVARAAREAERAAGVAEGRATAARERAENLAERSADLLARSETHERAAGVLNVYGEERAGEVVAAIERVVSEGLSAVFGEEMTFRVRSSRRGKTNTTELTLETRQADGTTLETDLLSARGGGVAAVAGFLLRATVLLLTRDARRILVLDESFAQLSSEYEPSLAAFIRELADRTSTQVLMVTHSDAYSEHADVVYRVSQEGGRTVAVTET